MTVLFRTLLSLLVAGLGALALCGCQAAQKTLIVKSDPPGATVWINGEKQDQVTPIRVPFEWYGDTEVRLEKEGYSSVSADVNVPSEIDGYPVIDLLLLPFAKDKDYPRTLKLTPIGRDRPAAEIDRVRARAESFRTRTLQEVQEPGTPVPSSEGPSAR